ncbi:hypothetical protein [Paraburkholderia dipogonis]|uniref:hypothetical protein n=1 Tax=Paraburkholderia dipogonis TaxID=1211383 RepID=UPI0038BE0597
MTGMFEAYPVDESARPRGSGWSLAARVIRERLPPRVVRMAWLGALAADASEHGGRIFIMALILEVKRRKGNSPISLSLKRFSH